jgi:hypothetical protein
MVTAANGNHSELRKSPRQNFRYGARILIAKDAPQVICSIIDISTGGARLLLKSNEALPETFILLLAKSGMPRRDCRLVWRDGLSIGVKFPDPS